MITKKLKDNAGHEIELCLRYESLYYEENYKDLDFDKDPDIYESKNLAEELMYLNSTRHSGFYRIRARIFENNRRYGYALLHRGKDLPELQKMEGIIEYMFTDEAVTEMKEDKVMRIYSLDYLCDLFSQDEVEKIISVMHPKLMYITIEPVLRQSLTVGVPEIAMPLGGTRDTMNPTTHNIFEATVNWSDKPFDFF